MRSVLLGLWLTCVVPFTASWAAEPGGRDRSWVANVVSRISEVERKSGENTQGGTVALRLRIDMDGSLDFATVEESSGSTAIDERALRAARAAAPFDPPPKRLRTLEGFTELSFPLRLDVR